MENIKISTETLNATSLITTSTVVYKYYDDQIKRYMYHIPFPYIDKDCINIYLIKEEDHREILLEPTDWYIKEESYHKYVILNPIKGVKPDSNILIQRDTPISQLQGHYTLQSIFKNLNRFAFKMEEINDILSNVILSGKHVALAEGKGIQVVKITSEDDGVVTDQRKLGTLYNLLNENLNKWVTTNLKDRDQVLENFSNSKDQVTAALEANISGLTGQAKKKIAEIITESTAQVDIFKEQVQGLINNTNTYTTELHTKYGKFMEEYTKATDMNSKAEIVTQAIGDKFRTAIKEFIQEQLDLLGHATDQLKKYDNIIENVTTKQDGRISALEINLVEIHQVLLSFKFPNPQGLFKQLVDADLNIKAFEERQLLNFETMVSEAIISRRIMDIGKGKISEEEINKFIETFRSITKWVDDEKSVPEKKAPKKIIEDDDDFIIEDEDLEEEEFDPTKDEL